MCAAVWLGQADAERLCADATVHRQFNRITPQLDAIRSEIWAPLAVQCAGAGGCGPGGGHFRWVGGPLRWVGTHAPTGLRARSPRSLCGGGWRPCCRAGRCASSPRWGCLGKRSGKWSHRSAEAFRNAGRSETTTHSTSPRSSDEGAGICGGVSFPSEFPSAPFFSAYASICVRELSDCRAGAQGREARRTSGQRGGGAEGAIRRSRPTDRRSQPAPTASPLPSVAQRTGATAIHRLSPAPADASGDSMSARRPTPFAAVRR